MNLYPIYYKDTPLLIFALSLTDAKIPYDRVSMKSHSHTEFRNLLEQAKDTPIQDCKLILSGPNIPYRDILSAQKNLHTFSRHAPTTYSESPIQVSKELEDAFEEDPIAVEVPEKAVEVPKIIEPIKEVLISDDLASLFDEINETSKEINIVNPFD